MHTLSGSDLGSVDLSLTADQLIMDGGHVLLPVILRPKADHDTWPLPGIVEEPSTGTHANVRTTGDFTLIAVALVYCIDPGLRRGRSRTRTSVLRPRGHVAAHSLLAEGRGLSSIDLSSTEMEVAYPNALLARTMIRRTASTRN